MLTLEQSRQLLNDPTLTDEEIQAIREAHYALAEIIYEQWLREREKEKAERAAKIFSLPKLENPDKKSSPLSSPKARERENQLP